MAFSAREHANTFRQTVNKWGSLDYRTRLYRVPKTSATSLKECLTGVAQPNSRPSSAPSARLRPIVHQNLSTPADMTEPTCKPRSDSASKPNNPREPQKPTIFVVEGTARLRKELFFVRSQLAEQEASHNTMMNKSTLRAKELEEELRVLKEKFVSDESRLKEKVAQLASDLVDVEGALQNEKTERLEAESVLSLIKEAKSELECANNRLEQEQRHLRAQITELEIAGSAARSKAQLAAEEYDKMRAASAEESSKWRTRCAKLAAHLEWRGKAVDEDCEDLITELEEYRRQQTPTLVAHLASGAQASAASRSEAAAWESAYRALTFEVEDCKRHTREKMERGDEKVRMLEERARLAEEHTRVAEERTTVAEERTRVAEERARAAEARTRAAEKLMLQAEREARISTISARRAVPQQEAATRRIPVPEPKDDPGTFSSIFSSPSVDTLVSIDAFNLQSSCT